MLEVGRVRSFGDGGKWYGGLWECSIHVDTGFRMVKMSSLRINAKPPD